jgi:Tol biopolymer transport system component/SH3-like domain-containing protein
MSKRRSLLLLFISLLFFSNLIPVFAQELTPTPTETETPTLTATASETPTLAPSLTLAPLPSETATETAAPTLTETPTSTVTATGTLTETPTSTATGTGTATSTPPFQMPFPLLYQTTFDRPYGVEWAMLPRMWQVSENGGKVRLLNGQEIILNSEALLDVGLSADVDIKNGAAAMSFRVSAAGRYTVMFRASGQIELYRATVLVATTLLPVPIVGWYEVGWYILGNSIVISVDGNTVLDYLDPAPLPPGLVLLKGEISFIDIDNVSVYAPPVVGLDSANALAMSQAENSESVLASASQNTQIVFYSERTGNSIFRMDGDGGNQTFVTQNQSTHTPEISPDGTKIAFVSGSSDPRISITTINGSNSLTLANTSGATPYGITWSPDGTRIAFSFFQAGTYGISVINLLNGTRTLLANNAYWPSWSPDGSKIAFVATNEDIYTINSDGTNLQRLTISALIEDKVSWSPDGTRIAYTGFYYQFDPISSVNLLRSDLYVLNLANGDISQITADGSSLSPDWSPDGNEIVYVTQPQSNFQIYSIGSFGGSLTRLTFTSSREDQPSWGIVPPPIGGGGEGDCTTTVIPNATANVSIRTGPSENSTILASAAPNTAITALGKDQSQAQWYRVVTLQITGWIKATLVVSQPCFANSPILNGDGTVQPTPTPTAIPTQTPTPNPSQCVGNSINRQDVTNARSGPSTNNEVLYTFGEAEGAGVFDVQIIGRFTNNSIATWDDWYNVTSVLGEAWASAQYTTLRPGYRDPVCGGLPHYGLDENSQVIEIESQPISARPASLPIAVPLFDQGQELRLPDPFSVLPVVDDALRWAQGYGMNTFAFKNPNYYNATNQIHSGLDFGGFDSISAENCIRIGECIRILPICDGIVVSLNGSTGSGTGAGFTQRCFTPEGSLSNLYLTYNHLRDTGSLRLKDDNDSPFIVTVGSPDFNLFAFQYPGNDTPHLHLEVFYSTDENLSNAIRINPLILFDQPRTDFVLELMGPYYPFSNFQPDPANVRYEWLPLETVDPPEIANQQFNAVLFNSTFNGIPESQRTEKEDMDLGILAGELAWETLLGDFRVLSTLPENLCTYIWARIDQTVLFQADQSLLCTVPGIQNIQSDANGPEWLLDRWIRTMDDLLTQLPLS